MTSRYCNSIFNTTVLFAFSTKISLIGSNYSHSEQATLVNLCEAVVARLPVCSVFQFVLHFEAKGASQTEFIHRLNPPHLTFDETGADGCSLGASPMF